MSAMEETMPGTRAPLVIEISTSDSARHAPGRNRGKAVETGLGSELRRCLQPGTEIALAFPGFTAVMSVVWIAERPREQRLRAGVRLLGVSPSQGANPKATESSDSVVSEI